MSISKKKTLAIFGLGAQQLESLFYLKKKYNLIGFDEDKNCPGKKLVKKFFCINIKKEKLILKICKKNNVYFAISFCNEFFLNIVSRINRKIGISKFLKLKEYQISDKYFFRKKLSKKYRRLIPDFFFLKKKLGIGLKSKKPFVIKPRFGSGSKGVALIHNFDFFKKHFFENKKYYKKGYLIENYIPGTEYAVDGWVYKKKFIFCCLSKKETSEPPYLLDTSIIVNYKNTLIKSKIIHAIDKVIKVFDLNNVPIHAEFKVKNKQVIIMDFSIRGAGSWIYNYIMPKIIGENTTKIQLELFLNRKINFLKPNNKIFFILFFPPSFGHVLKLLRLNVIKKKLETYKIFILKKKFDRSKNLKNGSDRVGQVIIECKNFKDLLLKKKYLLNTIKDSN